MTRRLLLACLVAGLAGGHGLGLRCHSAADPGGPAHALEGWLGELSDAQLERVRQFNDAARLNGEMRDRERGLSVRQRALAVARLRECARDFQLLAAAR